MSGFRQEGGCICGDVRFVVEEDPVLVYVCHCTDCQTETGSVGIVSVMVHEGSYRLLSGEPVNKGVGLPDGRNKGGDVCPRCGTHLGGARPGMPLRRLDGGTFDDTTWIVPAGHIFAASRQPWVEIPEGVVRYEGAPGDEGYLEITRAWKARAR